MPKPLFAAMTFACLLSVPAAAAGISLTPQPAAGETLGQANGRPALQSDGRAVGVVLVLQQEPAEAAGSPIFLLGVHNSGAAPLGLTLKAVVANADGAAVRVLSGEEMKAGAQTRLAVANAELSSATDRFDHRLGKTSTQAYVPLKGGGYAMDDRPLSGSRAHLAEEARKRVEEAKAAVAVADAIAFKPATIPPGDNAWTPVVLTAVPRGAATLQVAVTLAGETHTFAYAVTRLP
jgi:hypothetical protein